jgi:hypothetical protein
MTTKRWIGTALAGVAAFGAATAATAAPRLKFELKAKGEETKGRARAVGTVQLQMNNRGKQRAVVKARLNDFCPPDGYGAYLQVRAYYRTDASVAYSSDEASDTRGCEAAGKDVVLRTGWTRNSYKITIRLHEYNAGTGDIATLDRDSVEYAPEDLSG